MSIGIYGTVRPADVSLNDIDIFYNYTSNRETKNTEMFRLDPNDVLETIQTPIDDDIHVGGSDNLLEGLYNLTLPADVFNDIGIYTIYIRPKTYILEIIDCGTLSSLPNIRGLVIEIEDLPENLEVNNALQGYRVEYLDDEKNKVRNLVRYIVSSNKVVPVTENVGNTNQQATRYRFDDIGTHLFLQLTPSSAANVKPNQLPFIGNPGGIIKITNTYFTPLVMEIEMVENTVESLTNLLMGEQVKDVRNGILTYYDSNRNIVKQYNLFTIKDSVHDVPLYEVKEIRDAIDESQDFDSIIDEIE